MHNAQMKYNVTSETGRVFNQGMGRIFARSKFRPDRKAESKTLMSFEMNRLRQFEPVGMRIE
jgi:hypothetical protein